MANTYEFLIVLMSDRKDWSAPEVVLDEIVLPPIFKRQAERRRNKRKKNSGEKISKKYKPLWTLWTGRSQLYFLPKKRLMEFSLEILLCFKYIIFQITNILL